MWSMSEGLITALDRHGTICTCFATTTTLCSKSPTTSTTSPFVKHTNRLTSSARNQPTWREAMLQESCVTRAFQGKNCAHTVTGIRIPLEGLTSQTYLTNACLLLRVFTHLRVTIPYQEQL